MVIGITTTLHKEIKNVFVARIVSYRLVRIKARRNLASVTIALSEGVLWSRADEDLLPFTRGIREWGKISHSRSSKAENWHGGYAVRVFSFGPEIVAPVQAYFA